jgi:two-component system phosphate regulon sensor histidine kinase PhoR
MDRMRTDFVANASHELRTPLASLMGFIETMQGPARNDEAARTRFFGIMLEQAQRMARLIDDLLSLSRLEMRAHVAPQGEVELVGAVGHVIDTLRPMATNWAWKWF